MRVRNGIKVGAVLGVIGLSLAACSSGSTGDSTGGSTEGAGAKDGKYNVSFIQGVIGDEFYISMECGVRDTAKEMGNVEVSVQGPQKWDPALQQPILTSVVASKPDAILIAPNDVTALQKPLEEAAKTSKIVLVDTTVNDASFAVSEISSDNLGGGKAAFEAIQQLVPNGGKVLVIDNQPGISTTADRVKGFEDASKADSKYEYVGVQYAQNQPAKAADIVTSTIQKYPDLAGIFATNIFSAQGAATGIRQAGKAGAIKVVGFDAGPAQVDALKDDTIQAIIAQQPYDIGKQGVEQAVAALKGESTQKEIKTGFTILTKDNLDTDEGKKAIYATSCS